MDNSVNSFLVVVGVSGLLPACLPVCVLCFLSVFVLNFVLLGSSATISSRPNPQNPWQTLVIRSIAISNPIRGPRFCRRDHRRNSLASSFKKDFGWEEVEEGEQDDKRIRIQFLD